MLISKRYLTDHIGWFKLNLSQRDKGVNMFANVLTKQQWKEMAQCLYDLGNEKVDPFDAYGGICDNIEFWLSKNDLDEGCDIYTKVLVSAAIQENLTVFFSGDKTYPLCCVEFSDNNEHGLAPVEGCYRDAYEDNRKTMFNPLFPHGLLRLTACHAVAEYIEENYT